MSQDEKNWIRGSKGGGKGGGGGSAPVEEDNTLFSTAKARIIDLVSEGEISGLVNGKHSIFLDEVPLVNNDADDNFTGYSYATRVGTNSQSYIPGFQGSEEQVTVGVQVRKDAGPTVRSYTTTTADAMRLTLYTPALTFQKSNGDLVGSKVEFTIEMGYNGGNYTTVKSTSFEGKTTQRYERAFRFDIPSAWKSAGFTSIQLRVTRVTDDDDGAKTNNDLYWGTSTTIIDNKLTYPNSALVALEFDAKQFSSIPTRGYEIKGVKVKIPSNYTPYDHGTCSINGIRRKDRCISQGGTWTGTEVGDTLYSGDWDGTFTTAWTSNPAWIMYDICTDDRYGLGKWLEEAQMDKWALYEIAKYCDAVDSSGNFVGVDDGWGYKEARYTCNLYLQTREEAYKILNDIASIMRAMVYWQEGAVTPVQDAPKDPIMTFTDANVIDGQFTYEGSSRKQRHNVAHVTWNNPDDFYRQHIEYVEDSEGITNANNQIFSQEIQAVGCTSQSQARRMGKWLLYSERYETETVTFKTGMDGVSLRPGDNFYIADSFKAGIRYGGRVSTGSTSTVIQLDNATSVTAGQSYRLSILNTEEACIASDGSKSTETTQEACINAGKQWAPYIWTETKTVDTISTSADVTSITVTEAFENTPASGMMWILEEVGSVEAQTFKCLGIREIEPNIYEISGLKHYDQKYGIVEDNLDFSAKSTSNLPDPSDAIPAPGDLTISEELYVDSTNNIKNRATFSWATPKISGTTQNYPYVGTYYVEYRRKDTNVSNWMSLGETVSNSVTIDDAPAGQVEFRVKTRRIF